MQEVKIGCFSLYNSATVMIEMTSKSKNHTKRNFLIVALFAFIFVLSLIIYQGSTRAKIDSFDACAKAGYPIMESFPERCRVPGGKTFTRQVENVAFVTRGEMVCLPHKNQSGPQTLECAFGLKDTKGTYYSLSDTDPNYKNVSGVPMGKMVEVRGKFIPREDTKYQSVGIVEVESIVLVDTNN